MCEHAETVELEQFRTGLPLSFELSDSLDSNLHPTKIYTAYWAIECFLFLFQNIQVLSTITCREQVFIQKPANRRTECRDKFN